MAPIAAEIISAPQQLPDSLWSMFKAAVEKDASTRALTVCHQPNDHLANLTPVDSRENGTKPDQTCLEWTYRQLYHAALLVSRAILDAGANRGDTVLTFLPNGVETALGMWISVVLQLTLVPLDVGLLQPQRREDLAYYLKKMAPNVVLVSDAAGADAVDKELQNRDVKINAKFTTTSHCDKSGWSSFLAIKSQDVDVSNVSANLNQVPSLEKSGSRTAAILFTSGTSTGRPKGCPLSVRNLLSGCTADAAMAGLWPSWIITTVNFRAIYVLMQAWAPKVGARVVMPSAYFEPQKYVEAVEKNGAELAILVPAHVHLLAEALESRGRPLSGLKRVVLGGDLVTTDLVEKAKTYFPEALVTTGHGMTEGFGVLGTKGKDLMSPMPQFHSIYTVGTPGLGAHVRICNAAGMILNRGEEGELHLGGPSMVDHYLDNVQPELFYHDRTENWLRTGDKAFMDETGNVFILGRLKDIIKRGGISISPAVLEATLNQHEGVSAAVLGVPHSVYGEVPIAIVRDARLQYDQEQIKKIVTDGLGPDNALGDVVMLSEIGMSEFPLNATGKIEKVRLKEAVLRLREMPN